MLNRIILASKSKVRKEILDNNDIISSGYLRASTDTEHNDESDKVPWGVSFF